MDTHTLLQQAEEILKPWNKSTYTPEVNRLDIRIAASDLPACTQALLEAKWGYLAAITGLDLGLVETADDDEVSYSAWPEGHYEVLYHFCEGEVVVTLRIELNYDHPQVPTLCDLIPSATLYERELIEMLGVDVVGTPNRDHLLLSDDWPYGIYPLRKAFTGLHEPTATAEEEEA